MGTFLGGIDNGIKLYEGEFIEANEVLSAGVNVIDSVMVVAGIEEVEQEKIMREVSTAFVENRPQATDAIDLIGRMNTQLQLAGGLEGIVESYVGIMQNTLTNVAFVSVLPGLLDGVFGFTEMFSKALPVASLAGLYYSYNTRKSDRFGIAMGLFPWP